jgi:hypothetical protein
VRLQQHLSIAIFSNLSRCAVSVVVIENLSMKDGGIEMIDFAFGCASLHGSTADSLS